MAKQLTDHVNLSQWSKIMASLPRIAKTVYDENPDNEAMPIQMDDPSCSLAEELLDNSAMEIDVQDNEFKTARLSTPSRTPLDGFTIDYNLDTPILGEYQKDYERFYRSGNLTPSKNLGRSLLNLNAPIKSDDFIRGQAALLTEILSRKDLDSWFNLNLAYPEVCSRVNSDICSYFSSVMNSGNPEWIKDSNDLFNRITLPPYGWVARQYFYIYEKIARLVEILNNPYHLYTKDLIVKNDTTDRLDIRLVKNSKIRSDFDYTVSHSQILPRTNLVPAYFNRSYIVNLINQSSRKNIGWYLLTDGITVGLVATQNGLVTQVYTGFKPSMILLKTTIENRMISQCVSQSLSTPCPRSFVTTEILSTFYSYGDSILRSTGSVGFKALKLIEQVCVGLAQANVPDRNILLGTERNFYEFCAKEHLETLTEIGYSTSHGRQFLTWLNQIAVSVADPVSVYLELAGCFRHWGHPRINMDLGLQKLYQNGNDQSYPVDENFMSKLASELSYLLLKRYYNKHSKWPSNFSITSDSSRWLLQFQRENTFPSPGERRKHPDTWHLVDHDPLYDGAAKIDILSLLDDKAHGMTLSELREQVVKSRLAGYPISKSQRVITSALSYSDIEVEQFLLDMDADWSSVLTKDDLCIGLKAKERELTYEGRFFSLMSFKLRLYFTATEYMINKYIIKSLPEITLAKTYTGLLKSMNLSAVGDPGDNVIKAAIHLDLKKWNNFQRYESTAPYFRVIDRALGFRNLITNTHKILSACTFYSSDHLHKINQDLRGPIPYCFTEYRGGMEGIRQKGWSVGGALALRIVARSYNLPCRVLLQGDNQIAIVSYRPRSNKGTLAWSEERQHFSLVAQNYMEDIKRHTLKMGLLTKDEETWMSSQMLYYGKQAIVCGLYKPMLLKKLCGMHIHTNNTLQSLESSLSGMFTAVNAAMQQDDRVTRCSIIGYSWGYNIISWYLEHHPTIMTSISGVLKNREVRETYPNVPLSQILRRIYSDMLTRDSCLGGLGGSTPGRFLCRQFPDPLTESLSSIRKGVMSYGVSDYMKGILKRQANPPLSTRGILTSKFSRKLLLENPTGLNLLQSQKSSYLIKNLTQAYILGDGASWIKNTRLRSSIVLAAGGDETLVETLFRINPIFPKFISALYSLSELGQAEALVNKFSNTRTMMRLSVEDREIEYAVRFAVLEVNTILGYLIHTLTREAKNFNCATERADELRELSWGIKMVGVTVPHPLCQISPYPSYAGHCSRDYRSEFAQSPSNLPTTDYISVFISGPTDHTGKIVANVRGPWRAYTGSCTMSKRTLMTENSWNYKTPLVSRVENLWRAVGWFVKQDSVLSKFMEEIVKSTCLLEDDVLYPLGSISSGDPIHRFYCNRVSSGGFSSTNTNLSTLCNTSSNNVTILGRMEENYIIMFQSIFLVSEKIAAESFGGAPFTHISGHLHLHFSCPGCLLKIEPLTLDVREHDILWKPPIPKFYSNTNPLPQSGHNSTFISSEDYKARNEIYQSISESWWRSISSECLSTVRDCAMEGEQPWLELLTSGVLLSNISGLNILDRGHQIGVTEMNLVSPQVVELWAPLIYMLDFISWRYPLIAKGAISDIYLYELPSTIYSDINIPRGCLESILSSSWAGIIYQGSKFLETEKYLVMSAIKDSIRRSLGSINKIELAALLQRINVVYIYSDMCELGTMYELVWGLTVVLEIVATGLVPHSQIIDHCKNRGSVTDEEKIAFLSRYCRGVQYDYRSRLKSLKLNTEKESQVRWDDLPLPRGHLIKTFECNVSAESPFKHPFFHGGAITINIPVFCQRGPSLGRVLRSVVSRYLIDYTVKDIDILEDLWTVGDPNGYLIAEKVLQKPGSTCLCLTDSSDNLCIDQISEVCPPLCIRTLPDDILQKSVVYYAQTSSDYLDKILDLLSYKNTATTTVGSRQYRRKLIGAIVTNYTSSESLSNIMRCDFFQKTSNLYIIGVPSSGRDLHRPEEMWDVIRVLSISFKPVEAYVGQRNPALGGNYWVIKLTRLIGGLSLLQGPVGPEENIAWSAIMRRVGALGYQPGGIYAVMKDAFKGDLNLNPVVTRRCLVDMANVIYRKQPTVWMKRLIYPLDEYDLVERIVNSWIELSTAFGTDSRGVLKSPHPRVFKSMSPWISGMLLLRKMLRCRESKPSEKDCEKMLVYYQTEFFARKLENGALLPGRGCNLDLTLLNTPLQVTDSEFSSRVEQSLSFLILYIVHCAKTAITELDEEIQRFLETVNILKRESVCLMLERGINVSGLLTGQKRSRNLSSELASKRIKMAIATDEGNNVVRVDGGFDLLNDQDLVSDSDEDNNGVMEYY